MPMLYLEEICYPLESKGQLDLILIDQNGLCQPRVGTVNQPRVVNKSQLMKIQEVDRTMYIQGAKETTNK